MESKTKQKPNSQEERSDLWLPEAGCGPGELEEAGQKARASSFKSDKSRDVAYSMVTLVNTTERYM